MALSSIEASIEASVESSIEKCVMSADLPNSSRSVLELEGH